MLNQLLDKEKQTQLQRLPRAAASLGLGVISFQAGLLLKLMVHCPMLSEAWWFDAAGALWIHLSPPLVDPIKGLWFVIYPLGLGPQPLGDPEPAPRDQVAQPFPPRRRPHGGTAARRAPPGHRRPRWSGRLHDNIIPSEHLFIQWLVLPVKPETACMHTGREEGKGGQG